MRLKSCLSTPALVAVGFAASLVWGAAAAESSVTLLHTNDMHGRLLPFEAAPGSATSQTGDPGRPPAEFDGHGPIGGVAWLASAIKAMRARYGADNTLLLDAGDTFSDGYIGNVTEGRAMIDAMNQMGYDMLALGNHDFDYGFARTQALAKIADFPMRGANILTRDGGPVFGRPWQVFKRGGVRVAVLALGYQNTGQTGNPKNFDELAFGDGIEAARRYLPAMHKAADVTVVLSHQGTTVDRKLAREVRGLDLIVGGHSHDRVIPAEHIGDTWMVQAMSDAALLGVTRLVLDDDKNVVDVQAEGLALWHDRFDPDPKLAALVDAQTAAYADELHAVLATAADRIDRQYKSPSAFDRLVGDILRKRTGADVAFMPGVGYGVSISPGPVTRRALYTLLPHPAKLVTLTLTGTQIASVLEQSATNLAPGRPSERVGGLIQTSGLGYTLDFRAPAGQRIHDILINGQPLEPKRSYSVATNAGIARGLHRYSAFTQAKDKTVHDAVVADIVEQAFKKRGVLVSPLMNDIRIIPARTTTEEKDAA